MGKKQKLRKAAASAAVKVAQSVALANDDSTNKAMTGKSPPDISAIYNNMQTLMSVAERLEKETISELKNAAASDSDSSISENSESNDSLDRTLTEAVDDMHHTLTTDEAASHDSTPKYSRGEKRARRLLMKLDLERVPNVSRVTMRKTTKMLLIIDHPEVFKCPNSNTLICFGVMRVEDQPNTANAQLAERYINDGNLERKLQPIRGPKNPLLISEEIDEEDVKDDTVHNEKDIELVRMQSSCSRRMAVKALNKHSGDVVNAIMELTVGLNI